MNRRAAGEGTIRLHKPSGLYEARYYVPGDPRYKSVYARTEREAANRRTERLAEIARGGYASGGRQRLADYSRRWLDEVAAVSVRPVTHEQYERILRLHVLPTLGRIKLRDIRPGHVQSLYAAKAREGYSSRTLRYIQTTLGVVLKHAALVGEIPRNPAKGVPVPPQRPRGADDEEHPDPLRVLDSGGVQSLLEAARGDRLEALYHLALSTGLRQGELFALGWRGGVDLEAGEVRVRRTLSWIKGEGYTFAPPKNESSRRSVKLRPEAVLLLKVHRKRMLEERMMGARKAELGLVFCSTVGTPLRRQNVQRRNFKPLLERAGLPQEVRFHDLRHTFATLALSRGADVKTISHMLGHSSIRTTLDIYAHVLPQAQEDALKKLDGLFG